MQSGSCYAKGIRENCLAYITRFIRENKFKKFGALWWIFFMNSVVNGKVLENTPFESVYISHSPDDLGNSIGAAMYVYHAILRNPRNHRRLVSNLGPSFSSEAIDKVLSRRRIQSHTLLHPAQTIAEILSKGRLLPSYKAKWSLVTER